MRGATDCCALCLNHIRKRKRRRGKPFLLMDQYLLGLLCPGHIPPVDRRCHRRLQAALRQPTNPFRRTGVAALDELVAAADPVGAWWTLNLDTPFFRHRDTARVVRKWADDEVEYIPA